MLIIFFIFKIIGQILLSNIMIFKIMGIQIMLTLNFGVLPVKMLVLKVSRNCAVISLFYVGKCRIYGIICGI